MRNGFRCNELKQIARRHYPEAKASIGGHSTTPSKAAVEAYEGEGTTRGAGGRAKNHSGYHRGAATTTKEEAKEEAADDDAGNKGE
jgi:hypothetical protein